MIILIGERRIEVSHMAELRQLTITYQDEPPTEGGRVFAVAAALTVAPREGGVWFLSEDGTEVGEMPAGVYDMTGKV